MRRTRNLGGWLTALAAALAVCAPVAGAAVTDGRIGPALGTTGNGRTLNPTGRLTALGNFPTGSALTPDGRFIWAVDAGHGQNDVKVMDVASGAVVQTLPLPGAYVGVAFAPDGRSAYVSGIAQDNPASPSQGPTKGAAGDVVHRYTVDPATGKGTEIDPIALPKSATGTAKRSSLGAVTASFPEGLAVTPDGAHLVVALNQSDQVAIVDLTAATPSVRAVNVGAYPYGVVISPDSKTAYVSNEFSGTVSFVDIAGAREAGTVGVGGQIGDQNAHPEGMVADPQGGRLFVAVANRDLIAVVDTAKRSVDRYVSVARPEGIGAAPTALALSADGRTLYSADSNEDAVSAISVVARGVPGAVNPSARRVVKVRTPASIARYPKLVVKARDRLHRQVRKTRSASTRKRLKRSYKKTLGKLRVRYLYGSGATACSGPDKKLDRTYGKAILRADRAYRKALVKASRVRSRSRRAKLRARARSAYRVAVNRARGQLPPVRPCSSTTGDVANLPAYSVIGKFPTAAYPTDVKATPDGKRLLWVAGKGLGTGPNPDFLFAGASSAGAPVPTPYGTYVLDKLEGRASVLNTPTDAEVQAATPAADAAVRPANLVGAPAGTPVVGSGGGASEKIEHVFYVVRENRTYDQIFGSDPRGDGDPGLELFDGNTTQGASGRAAGVTPNAHALTQQSSPLLDHFYADSEVSVDGHTITSSAYATDYEQKAVPQNYAGRGRAYDFGLFPVSYPPNGFVFDQAARQGVSFRSYGEVAAGNTTPASDDGRPTYAQVTANTDYAYPNEALIGCMGAGNVPAPADAATNPTKCAHDSGAVIDGTLGVPGGLSRVDTFNGEFQSQLAAGTVPKFNYLVMPNDHTNGTTPGGYTPRALIADNDLALGQFVDIVSHSSIWPHTAIFVVEDDSQDGADHVDAHRMPAFVISPYAAKGVVHTRYDQYSALRTAMMMLGLHPLSLNDALALPMYDAFTNGAPDVAGTIYRAVQPQQSLTDQNTSSSPAAALSAKMPFDHLDTVPQAVLDRILWQSVYGRDARPPHPGPNASPEEHERAVRALRMYRAGRDPRAYLAKGGDPDDAAEAGEGDEAEEAGDPDG